MTSATLVVVPAWWRVNLLVSCMLSKSAHFCDQNDQKVLEWLIEACHDDHQLILVVGSIGATPFKKKKRTYTDAGLSTLWHKATYLFRIGS